MKKLSFYFLCLFILASCAEKTKKEYITREGNSSKKGLIPADSLVYLKDYQFPEKHINFFKYDNVGSEIKAFRLISPLRSIDEVIYIVDDDIQITINKVDSLSHLVDLEISPEEMATMNVDGVQQYSTKELVNAPKNIRICGINVTNDTLKLAVEEAINNYNDLGLELTFEFVEWFLVENGLDKNTYDRWRIEENIDIIITEVNGEGGLAGFPKNGLPHDFITIGKKIAPKFGLNVTTHVVTHEIGHCIGLRHTDYFNRRISCGKGGNEGDAGVGAIYIPGTPPIGDLDMESIMLACYKNNQTGEFSDGDKDALIFLYQ